MSYKSELEEHYKRVRARLRMGVQAPVVPKTLLIAAQPVGGIAGSTGVAPPVAAEAVEVPPVVEVVEPVSVEPVVVVTAPVTAPRITDPELMLDRQRKIAAEADASPKLPPLPGFDKHESPIGVWKRLVVAVANKYEVEVRDILGLPRTKMVIKARFECMYRMRVDLHMSYLSIAEKLNRDHSTVVHAVHTIRARLLDEQKRREQSMRAHPPGTMVVPVSKPYTSAIGAAA